MNVAKSMDTFEVIALLNQLLEAERAGARALGRLVTQAPTGDHAPLLTEIAKDEAYFCVMLVRHVTRLGGVPSRRTGEFLERMMALETLEERMDLLNRGQKWVGRRLRETLPNITDQALLDDLRHMLEVHEQNIARCSAEA